MPDVPGDSSGNAIGVGFSGGTVTGSIETVGDRDWYRLELLPATHITISLTGAGGTPLGDPYLIFRDQLGNIIDYDDDSGVGSNSLLTFATSSGGTFYIDAGSYGDSTAGDYQLAVGYAPGPPLDPLEYLIDQLISGRRFNVVSGGSLSVNVTALNAEGQLFAREALALWKDVTGINFSEVTGGAQITFDDSELGIAYCRPWPEYGVSSSAYINIGTDWIADDGTNLNSHSLQTYIHEIGHALGLDHGGNYNVTASYPADALHGFDSLATTVMSYFLPWQNAYFRDQGFTSQYPLSPMLADIYAVQAIYGAASTTRTGNTTYGFNSSADRAIFDATVCPAARYTIIDNGGIDTLDYSGYSADQTINLSSNSLHGWEVIFSSVGGGVGNVCIAPGTIIENVIGGSGNDILIANLASNVLNGGAGNDTASWVGHTGFSGVVVSLAVVGPQTNGDTLLSIENLTGSKGPDTLTGDASANILIGGDGGDRLYGGAGNDRLISGNGLGIDYLAGGEGDDYLEGGATPDVADYTQAARGVRVDLSLSGAQDTGGAGIDTLISLEWIHGSAFDDILTGNGANNRLFGFLGNDVLHGGASGDDLFGNEGNDYLDGGAGDDKLEGGIGDDVYVVDSAADVITEAVGGGIDEIRTALATFSLAPLSTIEWISGYGAVDQQLTGNGGNNRIDGGGGADLMTGGLGDDTYFIDNAGDVIAENDGEGIDEARSAINLVIGVNVENLILLGTAAIDGTGNSQANILTGNSGSNILDGGTGADTMAGGLGDDIYVVAESGDIVIEDSGAGIDLVRSAINYVLTANVDNLTLTGVAAIDGTGNSLGNVIIGNGAANRLVGGAGNDSLNGGAGIDTLEGGTGNDIYVIADLDDVLDEASGGGNDTVQTSISYTLGGNFENITLTGNAAINATGNSRNNVLIGNSAANILDGRFGSDQMAGGAGSDTYVVNAAGDKVTEARASGTDTVQSTIGYTLGAYVENLKLIGTGSVSGTGNDHNNIMSGNTGANVLNGAAGNDRIYGGSGNDSVNGGIGNDALFGSFGADSFVFDTALNATANVDKLEDFKAVDDTIMLDRFIFTGIGTDGTLAGEAFHLGTAAQDADDRIIYDKASGKIFYDADGNGAGAAILFATVNLGTNLTNLDFSAYSGG